MVGGHLGQVFLFLQRMIPPAAMARARWFFARFPAPRVSTEPSPDLLQQSLYGKGAGVRGNLTSARVSGRHWQLRVKL